MNIEINNEHPAPYGIREATEKVETKRGNGKGDKTSNSCDSPHYPSTSHYSLHQLYSDLLQFSAKHLKIEGRLVCWLPLHTLVISDALQTIFENHPFFNQNNNWRYVFMVNIFQL